MGLARVGGRALSRGARHCLIALCAIAVAELGVLAAVRGGPVTTHADPGPYRGTPAELVAAGQQLGIPGRTLARLQLRWGLPAGLQEPRPGYITAAYQNGHIYLSPSRHPTDALAYEYLHDVWAHLAPAQRIRVAVLLDQFDAAYRDKLEPGLTELIRTDVTNGASDGWARLDELHSIACSRARDEHLSLDLRAYCNYVLPGRRVTTKKY